MWLPDLIGCLGAFIALVAYALLQTRKLESESLLYSFFNLAGAIMVLISLSYAWNFAAVMMEIAWLMISAYGLVKGIFSYRFGFNKTQLENKNV